MLVSRAFRGSEQGKGKGVNGKKSAVVIYNAHERGCLLVVLPFLSFALQ